MINLDEVAEMLYEIQQTGSTLTKEALLLEHAESIKEVLRFIYDPYFTTGLKVKKLMRAHVSPEGAAMTVEEMMEYLKQNSTGTDWDAAIANGFIYSYDDDVTQWLAEALVTKDLQIGVSITTLNKLFGKSFIPRIGIMRGMQCPEDINSYYIATEKIDGNRRLIFVYEDSVEIYTRSGKLDSGLVEIEQQAAWLPSGYVYDTECVAVGDYDDSIALRQASASILNSKGVRKGVRALVFDMLPIVQYNEGQSKFAALVRKYQLAHLFNDVASMRLLADCFPLMPFRVATDLINKLDTDLPNISVLPILGIVQTKPEAVELAKPIWDAGGEGIMLVEYMSPYEVNPNPRPTLLKIKATNEYTCLCIDVLEGDNKYEGMMGAIMVDYQRSGDPNVYSVKVGSGFTDAQRELYWEHPEKIVGKIVEVESFGESRNAQGEYSLNCPIFRKICREDD